MTVLCYRDDDRDKLLRTKNQNLNTLNVTRLSLQEIFEVVTVKITPLAFVFSVCRIDTTRVEFTIPLRENWALPFFAIQIAAITYFLRPNLQPLSQVSFYNPLCLFLVLQFYLRSFRKCDVRSVPVSVDSSYSMTSFLTWVKFFFQAFPYFTKKMFSFSMLKMFFVSSALK